MFDAQSLSVAFCPRFFEHRWSGPGWLVKAAGPDIQIPKNLKAKLGLCRK